MRCNDVDQPGYGAAERYWNSNFRSIFRSGRLNEHSQHVQDSRTYQTGCANDGYCALPKVYYSLELLLLKWINWNPSMDKWLTLHPLQDVGCNNFSILNLQRCSRWRLAMAQYFRHTLPNGWNWLPMLELQLIDTSQRGPRCYCIFSFDLFWVISTYSVCAITTYDYGYSIGEDHVY